MAKCKQDCDIASVADYLRAQRGKGSLPTNLVNQSFVLQEGSGSRGTPTAHVCYQYYCGMTCKFRAELKLAQPVYSKADELETFYCQVIALATEVAQDGSRMAKCNIEFLGLQAPDDGGNDAAAEMETAGNNEASRPVVPEIERVWQR